MTEKLLRKEENGFVAFQAPQMLRAGGAKHLYTTRRGGVSQGVFASLNFRHTGDSPENIRENCSRTAALLGLSYEDLIRTQQKHTDLIDVVTTRGKGIRIGFEGKQPSDGLMTNLPGVCLMGFYADCQLLFFYDPVCRAVAAVHSGWRGTARGIAEKTVAMMARQYGTNPRDLLVSIGPSICADCFETDSDVYLALAGRFGGEVDAFTQRRGKKYHIDTKALNVWRLGCAGVPEQNIAVAEECTCCGDPALFWSHRRQGDARGVHAGLIALE
ncbi:peptidoglycan editing factor PgeF [Acidaminobacterium chupaoyuni]